MNLLGSSNPIVLILIVVSVIAPQLSAGPLPIVVTSNRYQAASGNSLEAVILVYLANPDGTPKLTAEIPGFDPNGGVQLKGSRWSFQTLLVPQGYEQAFTQVIQPPSMLNPSGQSRTFAVQGQLRIMKIESQGNGFYRFHILPAAGLKGAKKVLLKWISGEYNFYVSYKDGDDQGSALGVLTIR